MKILILFSSLFLFIRTTAQNYQYEFNYSFTLPIALSEYSPKTKTSVSPVKYKYPTSLKFSINPKIILNTSNKIGIYTSYDEYEYGFDISQIEKNGNAGLFIAGGRLYCALIKIGLTCEKVLYTNKHFEFGTIAFLNLTKETRGREFNDTLVENAFFRNHAYPKPYRQSILLSSNINSNIVFLPSLNLYCAYKIGTRFSINMGATYQQGFKNIVTTYTSIEIPSENKSAIYTAKFNGTAILGNFGLSYRFGKKDD